MRPYELISSLFWLLVGLGFAWGGLLLGAGSWINPGPGLLPLVFGIVLAALSAVLFALSFTSHRETDAKRFWNSEGSWKPVAFTCLSLIAYMAFLEQLGIVLTTFLFLSCLLKFVGKTKWLAASLAAAALAILIGLSSDLLRTSLPKGRIFSAWSLNETYHL